MNFYAINQNLDGDFVVDDISVLNLYLSGDSIFFGAVNSADSGGQIYVELNGNAEWILEDDSYITSLTCDSAKVNLNDYDLYINGTRYTEGEPSTGTAIEISSGSGNSGGDSGDDRPTPPDRNTSGDNRPSTPGGESNERVYS